MLNNINASVNVVYLQRRRHSRFGNLSLYIIPSATPTSHLKSTLRRFSHAGICETGLKSQSLLSEEVLSIHLRFYSCIHSDAQCHLKGRN